MHGKKQVSVKIVPVYLKEGPGVGEARVVSNEGHKPTTIVLGPDEGAIIGKFLHHADLTGIGITAPASSTEDLEKEGNDGS
jgi:hypothetical protein